MSSATKVDIYTRVTNKIIADLEHGVCSWLKPWKSGQSAVRPVRHNGEPYRGVNVLLLWDAAATAGYCNPMWMTFKQAKELGAQVRKGETGTHVVYANTFTTTQTDATSGDEVERNIPFLKSYIVFNAEQIDSLPEEYNVKPVHSDRTPDARIESLEQFFNNTGANIRHGGNNASFSITLDVVSMPPFAAFMEAEHYYATLAHEMTHWTRHPSRLDRDLGRKAWGDEGYAKEELVAELGAAFLCADLGITPEVREDHAAYIAGWLKVLKHDKRFVFSAAAHAQRAADHLHSYQKSVADTAAA